MNMSLGELNINGVSVGKSTLIDDLIGNPNFQSFVDDNGPVDLFISNAVSMGEYTFNIKIFYWKKRIDKIQLIPVNLEVEDPGYPDRRYQEAKKKISDIFLRSNLGTPSKENDAVLYYSFEWGTVSSVSFLSGRNEYTGGYIEISYNK